MRVALILLPFCGIPSPTQAQQAPGGQTAGAAQPGDPAPGPPRLEKGRTDVAILVGGAKTVAGFHLTGNHDFTVGMVQWGRVVTGRRGTSLIGGHLEVLVEILPFFTISQTPRVYGAGAMPVFLRWTLDAHEHVRPFVELAGGILGTNRDVPERTSRFNFIAYGGAGLRIGRRPAMLVGYRWNHISNGDRVSRNPGINSHMFYAGVSILR